MTQTQPKLLITGFSRFPGAPVNPTERLIEWLMADDWGNFAADRTPEVKPDLHFRLLATDYRKVDQELAAIKTTIQPDIAIFFGLSAEATGFQLETTARNHVAINRPDVAGYRPALGEIVAGGPLRETTLPLDDIHRRLSGQNLPVYRSDNAGDYVCNYLFYNAHHRGLGANADLRAGFIHVPYLDEQLPLLTERERKRALTTLSKEELLTGAQHIIMTCVEHWVLDRKASDIVETARQA
ncbi:MAG: hypothetical protein AAGE89_06540 [Pseudomonadota bacterium]